MAADVCLLLLQSLASDCDAARSPVPEAIAPLTYRENAALAPVALMPTTMPAIALAPVPQFAIASPSSAGTCGGVSSSPHTQDCAPWASTPTTRFASGAAVTAPPTPTVDLLEPVTLNLALHEPQPLAATVRSPQFSPPLPMAPTPVTTSSPRPTSGAQLYRQRQLALQTGRLYTRLPVDTFADQWRQATGQPTYQDWLHLLAQEARAVAGGQGQNRLDIVVGDSLNLWLPPDSLPRDRLWLNQSISGDTTGGIAQRVGAFAQTHPTQIHLLAGVNDLKNGVPEADIVSNLQRTVQQLKQQHPAAQIIVYSVLPTRRADITNDRVRSLNARLAIMVGQNGVAFRDVHSAFQDQWGNLRYDLTTDGLHLNPQGYAVWRQALLTTSG